MIHVVIPAAGNGRRFVEAGYPPKPHVLVNGIPMLREVIDNLRPPDSRYVVKVIALDGVDLPRLANDVEVVVLKEPTRGALETVLRGVGDMADDDALLVANCDQLLGFSVDELILKGWIDASNGPEPDGILATFTAHSPAHSYVTLDETGAVVEIAEKSVISDRAVAGVYYFPPVVFEKFIDAADAVMRRDQRVHGEFYVSTALAEMVRRGHRLTTVHGHVDTLGTPEELEAYHARGRG